MNKYIIIKGNDWDHPFMIEARFYTIDNSLRHYLFYTDDKEDFIIALNYYNWTIIGVNDHIVMKPTYIEVD